MKAYWQGLADNTAKSRKRFTLQGFAPVHGPYGIASPDGAVHVTVEAVRGALRYQASWQGKPALPASPLGLMTKRAHLGENVCLGRPAFSAGAACHAFAFPVRHLATGFTWTLEVCLAESGFAFRYALPNGSRTLVRRDAGEGEGVLPVPGGVCLWTAPWGTRPFFAKNFVSPWRLAIFAPSAEEAKNLQPGHPIFGSF